MATVIAELDELKRATTNFRNLDRNVTDFMATYKAHELDVEKTRNAATDAVRDALILRDSNRSIRKMIFDVVIAILMLILTAMTVHREWKDSHITAPSITAPKATGQIDTAHNQVAGKEF